MVDRALAGVMAVLNWISQGCDRGSLCVLRFRTHLEDVRSANALIVESAARADVRRGRTP